MTSQNISQEQEVAKTTQFLTNGTKFTKISAAQSSNTYVSPMAGRSSAWGDVVVACRAQVPLKLGVVLMNSKSANSRNTDWQI